MKKCSTLSSASEFRLIVGAAPAPPVPAPPGRPPLPLSSCSLRRRSSSWWFSNGSAHGRDTTTTATSSRATRRRRRRRWWWSDSDGSQQDYGSYSLDEEDDYEDEAAFSGFGWAEEIFDESWLVKVFKANGVILPVMLTSMFAATELKAFLMAMAIPLSQSAISFQLKRKSNLDDSRYYERRRRRRQRHNFQSWVYKDFADAAATAVGADDNTKSGGAYGGWDELLEAKRTKSRRPGRMRMRRRRMPRTMGLGGTRYRQAKPLMRWLVAAFPFLRSWFRLL